MVVLRTALGFLAVGHLLLGGFAPFQQSPLNLLVRLLLEAVDHLGVEAEEDSDAVARAARDLGGGDTLTFRGSGPTGRHH
ncbi:hypothetical protein GCM10009753_48880 [Streptantibioticus ferralitis]